MKISDLRIGNYIDLGNRIAKVGEIWCGSITAFDLEETQDSIEDFGRVKPIPLTEEWLLKFGFSVIKGNSAGKRYGYIINGIFNSDLSFTFWKTTKETNKFFRKDLELKSVHQLQNLYFALTNEELTIK